MLKIALVSLNPKWLKPQTNLQHCVEILSTTEVLACDLVVFPEMTLTGFSPQSGLLDSNFLQSCLEQMKAAAVAASSCVIFGGLCSFDPSNNVPPTNNAIVISSSGEILANYSKIHLFSFSEEHQYVTPGSNQAHFQINSFSIGLSICYDLRFPELYTSQSHIVNAFVNIASWPSKRIDHWYSLLKARAIENQSYMIGVNRTGTDGNGLNYVQSSVVFDPFGESLQQLNSYVYPELSFVTIDPSVVTHARSIFPVLNDRRSDLYSSFKRK